MSVSSHSAMPAASSSAFSPASVSAEVVSDVTEPITAEVMPVVETYFAACSGEVMKFRNASASSGCSVFDEIRKPSGAPVKRSLRPAASSIGGIGKKPQSCSATGVSASM